MHLAIAAPTSQDWLVSLILDEMCVLWLPAFGLAAWAWPWELYPPIVRLWINSDASRLSQGHSHADVPPVAVTCASSVPRPKRQQGHPAGGSSLRLATFSLTSKNRRREATSARAASRHSLPQPKHPQWWLQARRCYLPPVRQPEERQQNNQKTGRNPLGHSHLTASRG